MQKIIPTILIVLFYVSTIAQNDSIGYRNYFGANINSLITKLLNSPEDGVARYGVTYRRCIGLYNLKLAFVAINNPFNRGSNSNYQYADDLEVINIAHKSRSKSRDFRLGLESKWASKKSKIYVGLGMLAGKYKGTETYNRQTYSYVDTLGAIGVDRYYLNGWRESTYTKLGVDAWVGIAWDLGENLNLMIQYNPDISWYRFSKESRVDPHSEYYDLEDQFSWGVFNSLDVVFGFRF